MRDDETYGARPNERFRVRPQAVSTLAGEVGGLAEGAGEAVTYATGNLLMTNGGGSVLLTLNEWMYDLEGTMAGFFGDLQGVLGDSEDGLRAAARLYRTTDDDAAQRLDATYWSQ